MTLVYKLFRYRFATYSQGTRDGNGVDFALLHVPSDASFNNNKGLLMQRKHKEGIYEIDLKSIEDCTVTF